jgi:hypothetical protein
VVDKDGSVEVVDRVCPAASADGRVLDELVCPACPVFLVGQGDLDQRDGLDRLDLPVQENVEASPVSYLNRGHVGYPAPCLASLVSQENLD